MIERHLAHVSDEEMGGSYDRATFLEQRKTMVQIWADLLDSLVDGHVPLPATRPRDLVERRPMSYLPQAVELFTTMR